jgi:hypothetical protein
MQFYSDFNWRDLDKEKGTIMVAEDAGCSLLFFRPENSENTTYLLAEVHQEVKDSAALSKEMRDCETPGCDATLIAAESITTGNCILCRGE